MMVAGLEEMNREVGKFGELGELFFNFCNFEYVDVKKDKFVI